MTPYTLLIDQSSHRVLEYIRANTGAKRYISGIIKDVIGHLCTVFCPENIFF
jgi:hypothetical protein